MDTALGRLHALLPQVTLKPKNGVLWAYPSPEPEKPTLKESRPLILVAGAGCQRYQALFTALDILPSEPHSMTVRARPSAP